MGTARDDVEVLSTFTAILVSYIVYDRSDPYINICLPPCLPHPNPQHPSVVDHFLPFFFSIFSGDCNGKAGRFGYICPSSGDPERPTCCHVDGTKATEGNCKCGWRWRWSWKWKIVYFLIHFLIHSSPPLIVVFDLIQKKKEEDEHNDNLIHVYRFDFD